MNNFTTNTYEMKREIVNFSNKISNGLSKPTSKFLMDMQYGLAKNGSCLISNIARALDDNPNLSYTIERLCDNLNNLKEEEKKIIWDNYLSEVSNQIDSSNKIAIFDDSDINKEYSRKLEDLDRVIDASSQEKRIVNGYHVCEAVVLSKEQKQPLSVYSQIYSCKSNNFKSMNNYTLESIKAVENVLGNNFTGIFDRGYDDNKIYEYMTDNYHKFVIRLNDDRSLLFKGKKRNIEDVAKSRKGKIQMTALFNDNEKVNLYLSYTRAVLPFNKEEYTFVIVYGLSEDKPMKLLTNLKVENKEDVIKIVRLYLSRWKIEEYFRGKKQEYDFENMRVRTLNSMNNLNMLLTIHLGHIGMLAEKMNKNLLILKILYAGKSLKEKSIIWISQISRGIKEILKLAHEGIRKWQHIEERLEYKQLSLKL